MALGIRLKFQPDKHNQHPKRDIYRGKDHDGWIVEVSVPKGELVLDADIHFEFYGHPIVKAFAKHYDATN